MQNLHFECENLHYECETNPVGSLWQSFARLVTLFCVATFIRIDFGELVMCVGLRMYGGKKTSPPGFGGLGGLKRFKTLGRTPT